MDDGKRENPWTGRLFEVAVTLALGAFAYFVNGLTTDIKEIKTDTISLRAEQATRAERLAMEYVRQDEYRADISEIRRLLERIDRKVDGKVDRSEPQIRSGSNVGPGVWRDGRDMTR